MGGREGREGREGGREGSEVDGSLKMWEKGTSKGEKGRIGKRSV